MPKRPKPESKTAGPKRWGRGLLPLLCAVLLLVSVLLSYVLAVGINSFFEGILGEKAQAELEAPFVEELLKPLGLILLAAVLWWANRIGKVRVDWLKSAKVYYTIGYVSGLVFGLLENLLSYEKFSGLRGIAPFSHAFGAGMVGVGIYYVLTRGKGGLGMFAFLYSIAALLHFAWNNILAARAVLGAFETIIGLAAFLVFFQLELRGRFGFPPKGSGSPTGCSGHKAEFTPFSSQSLYMLAKQY